MVLYLHEESIDFKVDVPKLVSIIRLDQLLKPGKSGTHRIFFRYSRTSTENVPSLSTHYHKLQTVIYDRDIAHCLNTSPTIPRVRPVYSRTACDTDATAVMLALCCLLMDLICLLSKECWESIEISARSISLLTPVQISSSLLLLISLVEHAVLIASFTVCMAVA